ncbi:amino acid adenylation domain-containing protein [Bailinhaonella thermotolerans]|uniref:Phenyloxazoline synthase MbtB n=2 Tax=Bailinhaonella thermotolerans TaxID=1070861 RepID=A0A3A4AFB6_9ACTN|nr:amino acid adenylation domain-containing protein [Bailinhaonella thermotolerans]
MRRAVEEALGRPPGSVGDDDDLIGHGADSIAIMRLAGAWRRSGVALRFADLIEKPTLRAWWTLAAERAAAPAEPYGPAEPPAAGEPHGPGEPDRQGRAAGGGSAGGQAVTRGGPGGEGPVEPAPMQQAYWIGRGEDQVLGGVSAHFYAELDGRGVEPERLERAVRALLRRHGMLRARFGEDGRQEILPESPWPGLTVHDLRENPGEAEAIRARQAHRRLAAERGEVFDVALSLLPGGVTRTHVNIDMLVCDALSYQIVLADLAELYAGRELPPLDYGFPRYLAERARRRSDAAARAREHWRARLPGLPGAPQLPLAADPERLARAGVARRHHWIGAAGRERLAAGARARNLTLPAVLATAFAEVVAAWSAEPRFLLNLPIFDREDLHPDAGRIVGDFTNLLLLAVDMSGEAPFAERARRLQDRLRGDLAHTEYSGVEVLRDLARIRPGDWMMAPVVFTSAIGMGELFGPAVRRRLGTPVWQSSETPQVWLDHQVIEHDGGLLLNWDVVEELFPEGVVDGMFDAYLALLGRLAAAGDDAAAGGDGLSGAGGGAWERPARPGLPPAQAEARARVNATGPPHPPRTLHGRFFARAAREPDRPALAWGEAGIMSYGELAGRALRVAGALAAEGVRPGDAVAVTLPRGPDQIAAVLGVLAAGAAYVPVGVDQPAARAARIHAGAGVRRVIAGGLPGGAPPLPEPVPADPAGLAYVIYTSGSTGEPKGVEIEHRAAANTIDEINEQYGVSPDDRVLAVSALDFDLSAHDVFGTLSAGGTLVLVEEEARQEARRWAALAETWNVTIWNSVPAILDMLLIAGGGRTLRLALISGDWIGLDLPGRLAARAPGCRFVALGGATEAAIWSNAYEVTGLDPGWRSIPYGFPLRGQRYRVADDAGRDRPDLVPGELWIGGAGVARGYRGDAARTAERFVEHAGERWYRTGDLGRYRPGGILEFLGRADHQVKIRGHRIELGEIEAAALACPGVAAAAAVPVSAGRIGAAVTGDGTQAPPDPAAVRAFLASRLPAYMVPDDLVVLPALPLNANGKVDRAALPGLVSRAAAAGESEPPRGPVETEIAALWGGLLGVAGVGRGQSFFALGGDSLSATRLLEELRVRFGAELSLRRLFAAPTVAGIAALVAERAEETEEIEEGVI